MIYQWVTTPTEARDAMVSHYCDVLADHLREGQSPQPPTEYINECRAAITDDMTDDHAHEIAGDVRKACDQPTTLKRLQKEFDSAVGDPQAYLQLMGVAC